MGDGGEVNSKENYIKNDEILRLIINGYYIMTARLFTTVAKQRS
jgi:hypothetical protein